MMNEGMNMWKVVLPLLLVLLCGWFIIGLSDTEALNKCMEQHSAQVCYQSLSR